MADMTSRSAAAAPARRLCIAMATFDDFDGVWFTITSILLHHPEVADQVEFLVIDNQPRGEAAPHLKALERGIPNYRYVPFEGFTGTAVRDLLFSETEADILCCVDSHVMFAPGALTELIAYFDARPDCRDLVQGPLLQPDGSTLKATQFDPLWGPTMYGRWGLDADGANGEQPFEIPMQGLGVFACRRAAWPGLNPRLRGFGAEEGYLHEKFRRAGGRTVCVPGFRWVHRFARPRGVPYPAAGGQRLRNYLIAWAEVGWDVGQVEKVYREAFGDDDFDGVLASARADLAHPLMQFDALVVVVPTDWPEPWEVVLDRFADSGVAWRLERLAVESGPDWFNVGAELAVALCDRRHYTSIVVLDPEAQIQSTFLEQASTAAKVLSVGRSPSVYVPSGATPSGRQTIARLARLQGSAAGFAPLAQTPFAVVEALVPDNVFYALTSTGTTAGTSTGPTDDCREASSRRAVVAVLLGREHLPFIRHWCEHHLADGWEVFLFDNTGSQGSLRQTSAFARPDWLANGQLQGRPSYGAYTQHLDDAAVSESLADSVADLPVAVIPWRPTDLAGRVVHGQVEAYVAFIEQYRCDVQWAAFIDCDEYLTAGPGLSWPDLLDRAEELGCDRVLLDGIRFESRWSTEGEPLSLDDLRCSGAQDQGSKNIVKLANVRRADIHWHWDTTASPLYCRPDRLQYGFRHYRDVGFELDIRPSRKPLRTHVDESLGVIPRAGGTQ